MTLDWQARAEREAAAILAETLGTQTTAGLSYTNLVGLVAIGWLQGANYGTHETLHEAEAAFDRLRAAL